MTQRNPYDWIRARPRFPLTREPLLSDLVNHMLAGTGCVLMGGRGMGKSVLVHQVATRIRETAPEVTVVSIPGPPAPVTVEGCFAALEDGLGLSRVAGNDAATTLRRYFDEKPAQRGCVLLFDEIDQYVAPRAKESVARTLLNHLEVVRRNSTLPIGILAAGGLGLLLLRDYFGSVFLSRAYHLSPVPFSETDISQVSRPFADRGAPLSEGVLKAIHLASGGNPALVTYGLQHLWLRASPEERDVAEVYSDLRERYPDFLRDLQSSVSHPEFSEVPLRVWAVIRQQGPSIPRAALLQAASGGSDVLRMDLDDALRLLRGAGLVTLQGSVAADPLFLRAVASIVNLPEPTAAAGTIREQLVLDLTRVLTSIHRWAPDFFHTPRAPKVASAKGSKTAPKKTVQGQKRIVPEAVFSAILAIGFANLGWVVEREAMQGEGRTDLKLTRSGQGAVVEVKIWERNDYAEIHSQVQGYWAPDVSAAAAVMLTDQDLAAFGAKYRATCLSDPALVVTEEAAEPPLRGHFSVGSKHPDGFDVLVDHLLLRIPRG